MAANVQRDMTIQHLICEEESDISLQNILHVKCGDMTCPDVLVLTQITGLMRMGRDTQ
jgi:hypothetical protein